MKELDSTDCVIEMDVWEDMEYHVLISDSCVDNSLCLSSQTISSYKDVAYIGDFADEDFIDTGFDMGSEAEFEWKTRNDACAWECRSVSGNDSPELFQNLRTDMIQNVYRQSETDDDSDTDSAAELEYDTWNDACAWEFRSVSANDSPG